MCTIISEACFYDNRSAEIMDTLRNKLAPFGPIVWCGDGYAVNFEIGSAILKAIENMLIIRIEAVDLISSYAIKTIIEGYLLEVDDIKQAALLWIPAKVEPFASLADFTGLRKNSDGTWFQRDGSDEGGK